MKRSLFWVLAWIITLTACQPVLVTRTRVPTSTERSVEQPTTVIDVTALPPTEVTMAVTPLPNHLGVVMPQPGESYTTTEYEKLASSLGWNATVPGICFSIAPHRFMEPGDFPTAEEWLTHVHLAVDGSPIMQHHSLLKTDSEGRYLVDPDTKETLWKEPSGSPLRVCYAAQLGAGRHTATLTVETTSGEETTYTWQFVITEVD